MGPQVSNALSEGSVGGTLLGQQIANALANGSFGGTLVGQQIANALSDGSLGTILPGQQVTDSLSDVIFDGDTLSFFRQTPQGLLDMSLKLEGNTLSGAYLHRKEPRRYLVERPILRRKNGLRPIMA